MKVLLVSHRFPPLHHGGTELYTYNLAKSLIKAGHEVWVVYRSYDPIKVNYSIIEKEYKGIKIFTINKMIYREGYEKTYQDEKIDTLFTEILNKVEPDVVHINHLLYLSFGIVDRAKDNQIPIVMTLHDYWLLCPQIHLHKNYNICNAKDLLSCSGCIEKQGYINGNQMAVRDKRAYEVLSRIDRLISPSLFLKRKMLQLTDHNVKYLDIIHLPNSVAIDKRVAKSEKRIQCSEKVMLGYFGTIEETKGLHVLLDVFEKLDKEKFGLRVYGTCDKKFAATLDCLFPKWRNYYHGVYTSEESIRLMQEKIDVLVLPSIIYENHPTVINEALFAGVPVVAADVGGAPEMIDNGYSGLMFKNLDSDSLFEKINNLTPDIVRNMQKNLRSFEPYTLTEHVGVIIDIYNELLNEKLQHEYSDSISGIDQKNLAENKESKKIVSKLEVDSSLGNSCCLYIEQSVILKNSTAVDLHFFLEKLCSVERIRFDPAINQLCRFLVKEVQTDGCFHGINGNMTKMEMDGWDYFSKPDHTYNLSGDFSEARWVRIKGEIDILEDYEAIKHIEQLQKILDNMVKSRIWKITKPIRVISGWFKNKTKL